MNTIASTRLRLLAAAVTIALALVAAATSKAATITWGAAQNITGDTNVSTNGTLVDAFNIGPGGTPTTVVNGVNFASFAYPTASLTSFTQGNYKVEVSASFLGSANTFGSGSPPFSSLSAPYQTLLSTGGGASIGANYTLTMSGLTVGQTYEFQWWSNNSTATADGTTATAGNAVTLDSNLTNLGGGTGQFAIGSFIADNAAQQIVFTRVGAGGVSTVNGFQLRQLGAGPGTAVPEPGSALVGLMVLGLCGTRLGRRQRTAQG
jgi:hypothetical protein